MKVIKSEILITRRCNLACSYCAMPRKGIPELPVESWYEIFSTLVEELGCSFFAIYGAEPLVYPGIFDILKYLFDRDMPYSLLTNAVFLDEENRRRLLDANLQSITFSMDTLQEAMYQDRFIARRTLSARDALDWAVGVRIPDIQVTSTVHARNIEGIPNLISYLTSLGVWWSFDFIHDHKGFRPEHSKTTMKDPNYAFSEEDVPRIRNFLNRIREMKQLGYKIYQSKDFLDFVADNPLGLVVNRSWVCDPYPAWLTIDADGTALVCDDYLVSSGIPARELPKRWEEFMRFRGEHLLGEKKCRGCVWSTHWMAYKQLDHDGVLHVTHGRKS